MQSNSEKYSLNKTDVLKILRGGIIVLFGSAITYAADTLTMVDFGNFTPIAVAAASSLIEAARRWLKDYSSN